MSEPETMLSANEQQSLLRIARDSLRAYVQDGAHLDLDGYPLTAELCEHRGVFVTLRRLGELRGCIGHTRSMAPLAEAVRDNTVNAAARDPRFLPVGPAELDEIRIEISALNPGDEPGSPFICVTSVEEIVLGRDGLYLEHAGPGGGGLLLPQVPVEQGWGLEEYLEGLCEKAGAPSQAWENPGVRLYRFTAQVFAE